MKKLISAILGTMLMLTVGLAFAIGTPTGTAKSRITSPKIYAVFRAAGCAGSKNTRNGTLICAVKELVNGEASYEFRHGTTKRSIRIGFVADAAMVNHLSSAAMSLWHREYVSAGGIILTIDKDGTNIAAVVNGNGCVKEMGSSSSNASITWTKFEIREARNASGNIIYKVYCQ